MTTVARGRCTSAPVEVAIAIGTNPRLATNAVISTGRSRRREPCHNGIADGLTFVAKLIDRIDQHHAVQDGNSK